MVKRSAAMAEPVPAAESLTHARKPKQSYWFLEPRDIRRPPATLAFPRALVAELVDALG
jgi:hypothetical protein